MRVHAGSERLVQDPDVGIHCHQGHHCRFVSLTARQLSNWAINQREDFEIFEQFQDSFFDAVFVRLVRPQDHANVPQHAGVRIDEWEIRNKVISPPKVDSVSSEDLVVIQNAPRVRLADCGQTSQKCGLTGSVRAEHCDNLSGVNRQANIVQCLLSSKVLCQVLCLYLHEIAILNRADGERRQTSCSVSVHNDRVESSSELRHAASRFEATMFFCGNNNT